MSKYGGGLWRASMDDSRGKQVDHTVHSENNERFSLGSDIYIDEFTGRCFFIEGMAASRPKRTTALQGGVRMAASRPKRTTALQGGVRA